MNPVRSKKPKVSAGSPKASRTSNGMKSVFKSALLSMIFVSNLTIGSKGTDVVELQQFLVAKDYLQMPAGVSYGYFGPLTKTAVAKWQGANGISPAVGYFGPISRQAIVQQMTTAVGPSATVPISSSFLSSIEPDTLVATGIRANRVVLFRTSPHEVRPGDVITLNGSGFSKTSNRIYFNGGNSIEATSTNGTTVKVSLPTNLSEGEYQLSVSNILGSSDNPNIKVLLRVTNDPQPGPIIESASIAGETVTLIGKGFTSTNNLFTTLGYSLGPVSSNGTTLTFSITDLSLYDKTKKSLLGRKYQMPLWVYVQNEHGINANPYKLEIII